MSLTPAALRSRLHSLHYLNRCNLIRETGGVWRAPGQANKGIINITDDIVFTGEAGGTVPFTKQFAAVMMQE